MPEFMFRHEPNTGRVTMKITHDLPPPAGNEPLVTGIDIQAVTRYFPSGPVAGFRWRYQLAPIRKRTSDPEGRQTEWVFCSREAAQSMVQTWQLYLHQSQAGQPGAVQ
jgi:hypothetical protein